MLSIMDLNTKHQHDFICFEHPVSCIDLMHLIPDIKFDKSSDICGIHSTSQLYITSSLNNLVQKDIYFLAAAFFFRSV